MSEKKQEDAVTSCLAALLMLALVPVTLLWDAFVLKVLWGWFIVPQFRVSALSMPYALGIFAIWWLFQWNPYQKDMEGVSKWELFGRALGVPLMALLFGYLVHLYV